MKESHKARVMLAQVIHWLNPLARDLRPPRDGNTTFDISRSRFLQVALGGILSVFVPNIGITRAEEITDESEYGIPLDHMDFVHADHSIEAVHHPEYESLIGTPIFIISKQSYTVYTDPELTSPYTIPYSEDRLNEQMRGLMFQATYLGNNAAQILAEDGVRMPFGVGLNRPLFLDVREFDRVDDLSPLSVFKDTPNQDKQILLIQTPDSPMIFLLEGDVIIAKIPCVAGTNDPENGKKVTPGGLMRVSHSRVFQNMPTQSAVPYMLEITAGFGFHSAPWWNWKKATAGFYGSHQCINMPDSAWHLVDLGNGEKISAAEFLFRWAGTNLVRESPTQQAVSSPFATDEIYQGGINNVRVLGLIQPEDLFKYATQGSLQTSEQLHRIVDQCNVLIAGQRSVLPIFR